MLSRDMYSGLSDVATDELYAISGSGFGFPSDRYDDLELGASGTEYVAPANGWFMIRKITNGTNQYCSFDVNHIYAITYQPNVSSAVVALICPVKKGETVKLLYTAGGATEYFRFIYAEGE